MENGSQDNYYDEYEIDLREYIMLLWDHKLFIAGFVILAVIAAFIVSTVFLSPQYETEAIILAPDFELLNNRKISKEDYAATLTSDIVIENVLKKINQNREEENNLSEQSLIDLLSYELAENTDKIDFKFKFNDPEKTSSVLNFWIDSFIQEVKNFITETNKNYYDNIKKKHQQDFNNYQLSLTEIKNFESEINLELLNKNLNSKENKLVNLNSRIIDLKTSINARESELNIVSENLKKTEKFFTKKNIIDKDFLQKLQSLDFNDKIINLLRTEEEFLNPIYKNLIVKESNLSTELVSDKTTLDNYIEDKEMLKTEIKDLKIKISKVSKKENILQRNLNNSIKKFNTSRDKLNLVEQTRAEKDYEIIILSQAKIPEEPVSPNTKLNIAIAAVLGLMLAVFIVFFKEFMKEE